MTSTNMFEIVLAALAGLVLFLYAVRSLSENLYDALGDSAPTWIRRWTSNRFSSVLIGILVTILLDSSSAVIILTIVMVNSRILNFRQAMGIVMGANIGTTASSQIIAMDVGRYAPLLMLVGFGMMGFQKQTRVALVGRVVMSMGVLFFGLFTMENAVAPLHHEAFFENWMRQTENPLTGAWVGALVTLIIQSSSATVAMAMVLAKKGFLGLGGGIAIMLGAELGTCADTLLATIRGSRQALKTGLFHLLFNLVSIVLGLLLFEPLVQASEWMSRGTGLERAIAHAHLLFNAGGVALFIGLIPWAEKFFNRWLPERPTEVPNVT
ncbi:MAG: Na/Pi symporter [Bacteroidetes bacterium]|nr:Na/Pi symporter [Bacteroidota bacterium]